MFRYTAAFAIFSICLAAASEAGAQASADARVSATIVTPMTISQEKGQLELSPAAATAIEGTGRTSMRKRNAADWGGVSAEFNITGSPAYAYSISVPQYVDVVNGNKVITLATEARIESGAAKLSKAGTASIEVEGTVISTRASKQEMAFAMNYDDEEDTYVPNGLPITVNNN